MQGTDHQNSEIENPRHIAVIGTGVVGLATAWLFATKGAKVTAFGESNAPDMASWAAVGHVGLKGGVVKPGEEHLSKPGYVLKSRGLASFESWLRQIEKQSNQDVYWKKGFCEFFENAEEREKIFNRVLKNRIQHQKTWGNVQEIELDLESKKAGYFLYPEDIWVKPEDLLPALKSAYTSLGGKLVETLVKTFKLGKVKKIELFDHKSHSLGAFDGLVVASGNFAKSALSELGIAAKNLKKTKGWKSKVLRGPSCRNAFSTKDSIINLPQIEGLSSPHKVPFLEVRKVRPLVWREESVETSFSDDPNTKQARHGFRYEAVDQAPLVGPLAGAFDPFIALNICHHKSGFVTALPSAEILWKSFSKESLFPWEEALSPSRFRSKE